MKIDPDYVPTDNEEYMNEKQLAFFEKKLFDWKDELLKESTATLEHLKDSELNNPDFNDRATVETDTSFELRTRDRYRKLIDKINAALQRIKNKEYGYCLDTGEPIGVKRLLARPVATLTIEAQQRREKYESQHSED